MTPNLNVNLPGTSPNTSSVSSLFANAPNANTLGALVSQHRLLELSRFGLRGYDLAQHMLTQQGAVSKLLGKFEIKYFSILFKSRSMKCLKFNVEFDSSKLYGKKLIIKERSSRIIISLHVPNKSLLNYYRKPTKCAL